MTSTQDHNVPGCLSCGHPITGPPPGERTTRPRPGPDGPGVGTAAGDRPSVAATRSRELGQATVEYALVVLAAAAIALLLIAWAARTGRIGALFDAVFDRVLAGAG